MKPSIYKAGIALVPAKRMTLTGDQIDPLLKARIEQILTHEKARGAQIALFENGKISVLCGGSSKYGKKVPVTPDTPFRAASVSKHVTAYGVMLLARQGVIDLDLDVSDALGMTVRNPKYPADPITLRMLLSHTSSIIDSEPYIAALTSGADVKELLSSGCYSSNKPGNKWEYSNFAAGLIGSVLESVTGKPFDILMRETVFDPLRISASYYPQNMPDTLADAWRLFPPLNNPGFDAQKRRAKPMDGDRVNPERHYLLAHGSLCVTAAGLAKIAQAICADKEIFDMMRADVTPFGERDKTLTEGLGTFIYRENGLTLYGHQGLAYGAVSGLFYDENGKGFAVMTSAVSEERNGVMTMMNRALCDAVMNHGGALCAI